MNLSDPETISKTKSPDPLPVLQAEDLTLPGHLPRRNTGPVLRVEDLTVQIRLPDRNLYAVRDLSLSLNRGEILAIVGESGSGKTMLCRSILQLLPGSAAITKGRIFAGNQELTALSERELCSVRGRHISIVIQDPMASLDPTLPVGKQIAAAIRIHSSGRQHRKSISSGIRSRVIELMELVGIEQAEERCRQYPWQLSGGQRQRCVLAAALACEPDILIADEPTTALDVTIQAQILTLLKEIRAKTGISILFISHDLGVVAGIADRVAIMQNGSIAETAPVDELYRNPTHPYTRRLLASLPSNAPAFSGAVPSDQTILTVSHLSHRFRLGRHFRIPAVSDVSFRIRKGEILSLVGESGSGKSTIARCLMGIHQPENGEILYDDIPIHPKKHLSSDERQRLRQEIMLISQHASSSLNPHMTVREIIEEPLKLFHMFPDSASRNDYILQMLDEVHLDTSLIDRRITSLSGGQRQRVSIARAFGAQPRLLIADEPLASLDVTMQMQIVQLFSHLIREHDASMLFIAHDLSMVRFLSTRVAVMYRGHLVELAETEELYRNPRHPYTRALLEAMPIPDPQTERSRQILPWKDSLPENGIWTEVHPGHYVLLFSTP